MTHVDSEAVIVVEFRVFIDKKLADQFAKSRNVGAEERTDSRCKPIGSQKLMNAEERASVGQLIVEVCSKS